jgi:hypothetical protein
MAAASLVVRVSAQIAEFQKSFNDMSRTVDKFAGDFEGMATRAAAVGTFFGQLAADIAKSIVSGIGSAISDAVRLSSEFANAFTGLSSVAAAFGTDADSAAAAARRLSADGLLPVKDAATGLKNLLATGFSLPEAVRLMDAFKDSAAFGRQGALSFGDAIRQATEGVKNGNSILVDNAGITKNLSQILREAGKSTQDLGKVSSDASIRQALFNGILKESAAFSGDAARLTDTYVGQLSKLTAQYNTALASMGDVITQNKTLAGALKFVGDEFGRITSSLSNNGAAYQLVSGAVIEFIRVLASMASAVVLVQRAFTVLDNVMNVTILSMAMAVKALTDMLVQIVAIGSKLPGSTVAFAAFADELVALGRASSHFNGIVDSMQGRIKANHDSMVGWESTVGGLRDRLRGLADSLESTRGQTIQLGAASKRAASDMGGTGSAGLAPSLERVAKAAKEVAIALPPMTQGFGDATRNLTQLGNVALTGAVNLEKLTIPVNALAESFETLKESMADIGDSISDLPGRVDLSDVGFPEAAQQTRTWRDEIYGVVRALDNLAASSSGTFRRIVSEIANIADAWMQAAQATENYQQATTKTGKALAVIQGVGAVAQATSSKSRAASVGGGALAGAQAGMMFGPYGAAIGAVAGAIVGFVRTANQGRKAVKEFAEAFGGFDGLREKLNELGAEGEQLWINLTQKVGNGNVQQAESAIAAIETAFTALRNKQAQAVVDSQNAIAQAQRDHEASTAGIKGRIAELGSEYDRLWNSIRDEAPEEVMGIVEQQTRARMEAVAAERKGLESELEKAVAAFEVTMRELVDKLAEAAGVASGKVKTELEDSFKGIKISPIKVPVEYDFGNGNTGIRPPRYDPSTTSPAPDPSGSSLRASSAQYITVQVGEDVIARASARGMPRQLAVYGV